MTPNSSKRRIFINEFVIFALFASSSLQHTKIYRIVAHEIIYISFAETQDYYIFENRRLFCINFLGLYVSGNNCDDKYLYIFRY